MKFQLHILGLVILFLQIGCSSNPVAENQGNANAPKDVDAETLPDNHVAKAKQNGSKSTDDIRRFLPEGYSLLDSALGDLNLDAYPDMIMIARADDEEITSDVNENPTYRPLYILIGKPDGTFELAAKNEKTVYCFTCGGVFGDPYDGITIKNGYFSVEHYGGSNWRWTKIVTYKYDKKEKNWFLHKDGGVSYHTSNPEKMEEKVRTTKDFGRILFEEYDIYK